VIYGEIFQRLANVLGIEEVITSPRSPWQNAFAEWGIGSIRRECLDQIVVLVECHLKQILSEYTDYYNGIRTHLSPNKDAPDGREIQPMEQGRIVSFKHLGGLHHEYGHMSA
jgi:hypothetical protein